MLDSFVGAIEELGWRFQRAASAIGIRGQAIGDGGGGGVWDDAASERAHWSKRGDAYRHAVQKLARVDRTMAEVPLALQRTLALGFEPFGRASNRLSTAFTLTVPRPNTTEGAKVSLIGLVVETHAARVAFGKAHETVVMPGTEFLLRWLEDEAHKPGAQRAFQWMKREAAGRLHPALDAYETARLARVEAERAERREVSAERAAFLESELDNKHERERFKARMRIEGIAAGMLDNLRALIDAREERAARDAAEAAPAVEAAE